MITLDTVASFTWSFHDKFFLETAEGNYVWSDPDCGGDNTIVPFDGDYDAWTRHENIPFGRDKGEYVVRQYCGEDVKIVGVKK